MIRLVKEPKPQILENNSEKWTTEYASKLSGSSKTKLKYGCPEIKDALKIETHSKCAYCESKISHIAYGHVEHIKPKSIFPNLIYNWENLTFVCPVCNTEKRDYWDESKPILNPYIDDINSALETFGPYVSVKEGSSIGSTTITVLKLNRNELLLKRAEKIAQIDKLIIEWINEENGKYKAVLENCLREYANNEIEYSFTLKNYLIQKGVSFP